MKAVGKIASIGVLAAIGIIGFVYLIGGAQMLTAPFRGVVEQTETVNKGDYRIAAYDKFYDRCSAIQADEDRIKNLESERETADEQRRSRIDSTLTAVKNSRAEKVRGYNADAAKEATAGQFRSSDLPHRIDIDGETECSAQ